MRQNLFHEQLASSPQNLTKESEAMKMDRRNFSVLSAASVIIYSLAGPARAQFGNLLGGALGIGKAAGGSVMLKLM